MPSDSKPNDHKTGSMIAIEIAGYGGPEVLKPVRRSVPRPGPGEVLIEVATGGKGVDVILDMVGGSYINRNLKILALEGRLVQIAFLEGAKAEIDFGQLMMRRQTITGSTLRPRSVAEKGAIAQSLREKVWPLLESGRVAPVMYKTFPLAEAAEAHRLMESSRHIGKIVLTTARA